MGVSTKKGDEGYTSLYRGGRVPKHHLITEANGAVDEAVSHIGLGRSAAKEKRTKRILLQVQQDLFTVGAEVSTRKDRWKSLKKVITPTHVEWLDKLVEEFEEALALPPGFVAFGQKENASHLDVARTAVRRAERLVVKMKSEGLVENPQLLRYLNRLSDLIFLLASFEESDATSRKAARRRLALTGWREPLYKRWFVIAGSLLVILAAVIVLLLLFHGQPEPDTLQRHMESMESMHP
jgi:cob(I)alamin adenosyltransferase